MTHLSRPNFTAFMGQRLLAAGPLAEVALAVMNAGRRPAAPPIVIFSDVTGQPIDLDLRGTEREIIADAHLHVWAVQGDDLHALFEPLKAAPGVLSVAAFGVSISKVWPDPSSRTSSAAVPFRTSSFR